MIERTIDQYTPGDFMEDWDLDGLFTALGQFFPLDLDDADLDPETVDRTALTERITEMAAERYDAREQALGEELMGALERFLLLQIIDERWREHLFDMDYLREGIHLRGFAQIDPLVAYKNEAFTLFGDLMNSVWTDYARMIFNVRSTSRARTAAARDQMAPFAPAGSSTRAGRVSYSGGQAPPAPARSPRPPPAAGVATAPRATAQAAKAKNCCPSSSSASSTRSTRSGATIPAGAGAARSSRSATAPSGAVLRVHTMACSVRRVKRVWPF